jgi:hypothetical protein
VAAATEIATLPAGEQRSQGLRLVATLLVGLPEDFRVLAVDLCPDIENAEPIPDTEMTDTEQQIVSRLTRADIELIDQTLLSNSSSTWQGVARLIGYALVELKDQLPAVPLALYARRIVALAQTGALEAQGKLESIRLGKVRLPSAKSAV